MERRSRKKLSNRKEHILRGGSRRRLRLELLEDRRMLANVTVSNLNDVVNGTTTSIAALIATPGADGISLREAILAATADATADVIDFAPAVTGTIQLTNVGHAGEIAITNGLTINGPGAGVLAIRAFAGTEAAGDGARIFNINNFFFTTPTVEISGLTLTGGDVGSTYGGGAILNFENLTITGCTISSNSASDRGGGITNRGGNLSVIASTISGNTSNFRGGGIYSNLGSLTVAQSAISANAAGSSHSGGGIHSFSSPTTIDSSTISGNSAAAAGGIWSENAAITITNSTISGNSARASGGGLVAFSGLNLRHSTITLNRSDSDNSGGETGGGMLVSAGSVVEHTIVAGNLRSASTRNDISGPVSARYSLIGDNTGATITDNGGNQIGTGASPIDPLLGLLANRGGPTLVHALLNGSPAIDAGDPAAAAGVGSVPHSDQRGVTFGRVLDGDLVGGARIDIGAYEHKTLVVDKLGDETDGNTSLGELTIREAIQQANVGGGDTITFSSGLTSLGPAVILLTQGELVITSSYEIEGPGANLMTLDVSGSDLSPNNGDGSRVLRIDDGTFSTHQIVSINGLTLTGGDVSTSGGAIRNRELLTIRQSVVSGNYAGSLGGGIYSSSYQLNVIDSTINDNEAAGGGGIFALSKGADLLSQLDSQVTIEITGSTISGNSASVNGGGVFNVAGVMDIRHSTITGNVSSVSSGGGGLHSRPNNSFLYGVNSFAATLLHSNIIAGNTGLDVSSSPLVSIPGTSIFSNGYNLIGTDNSDKFHMSGDQVGIVNPLLGQLADNGGPTMTHALLAGSPAIDAGDPTAMAGVSGVPEFDQRGTPFTRVSGGRLDIGAYEAQEQLLAGDYNSDGIVNAADYVVWRDTLGSTTNLAANGDDSNSVIDEADYGVWKENFGAPLGGGASNEERGASALLASDRGTDTPVRPRSDRSLDGGQECPPHASARMLALLDLLDSLSMQADDDEAVQNAVFAGLEFDLLPSFR